MQKNMECISFVTVCACHGIVDSTHISASQRMVALSMASHKEGLKLF
jgi:hypothetical protein